MERFPGLLPNPQSLLFIRLCAIRIIRHQWRSSSAWSRRKRRHWSWSAPHPWPGTSTTGGWRAVGSTSSTAKASPGRSYRPSSPSSSRPNCGSTTSIRRAAISAGRSPAPISISSSAELTFPSSRKRKRPEYRFGSPSGFGLRTDAFITRDRPGPDSPVASHRIADQECHLQAHRRRALVRNRGGEVCDASGKSANPRRAGSWLRYGSRAAQLSGPLRR